MRGRRGLSGLVFGPAAGSSGTLEPRGRGHRRSAGHRDPRGSARRLARPARPAKPVDLGGKLVTAGRPRARPALRRRPRRARAAHRAAVGAGPPPPPWAAAAGGSGAVSSHAAPADPALAGRLTLPAVGRRAAGDALAFGAVASPRVALKGGGGLQLGPLTEVEMVVDVARRRARRRGARRGRPHAAPVGRPHARAVRRRSCRSPRSRSSGPSSPSDAWVEANRTLAYLAVVVAGRRARAARARSAGAALLGGVVAGRRRRLRLRAADEGLPRRAGPRRDLRAPARAVRLLERGRADGRAGRAAAAVARRPPLGPRRAQRARLSRRSACCSSRCCSPTRAARCSRWRRLRGVVRDRAAAPARRRRAGHGRASAAASSRVGLRPERAEHRQRRAGRARHRRPRARHPAGGDGRRAAASPGWRSASPRAPARALARRAPPGRHRASLVALALVPGRARGALALVLARPGRPLSTAEDLTDPTPTAPRQRTRAG